MCVCVWCVRLCASACACLCMRVGGCVWVGACVRACVCVCVGGGGGHLSPSLLCYSVVFCFNMHRKQSFPVIRIKTLITVSECDKKKEKVLTHIGSYLFRFVRNQRLNVFSIIRCSCARTQLLFFLPSDDRRSTKQRAFATGNQKHGETAASWG